MHRSRHKQSNRMLASGTTQTYIAVPRFPVRQWHPWTPYERVSRGCSGGVAPLKCSLPTPPRTFHRTTHFSSRLWSPTPFLLRASSTYPRRIRNCNWYQPLFLYLHGCFCLTCLIEKTRSSAPSVLKTPARTHLLRGKTCRSFCRVRASGVCPQQERHRDDAPTSSIPLPSGGRQTGRTRLHLSDSHLHHHGTARGKGARPLCLAIKNGGASHAGAVHCHGKDNLMQK